jgi:hypothetical protein
MIDMRKPKHRRIGEKNGKTDWKAVRSSLISIVIILLIAGVIFWLGMYHESVSKQKTVNTAEIAKEYKAFRVQGH